LNIPASAGLTYAGNHGLEILHADGARYAHPMPKDQREKLERLIKELKKEV
jgi:hypothetical protein